MQGGGSIGTDERGKVTTASYTIDDGYRLANPDGPEAATAITLLLAEKAKMREAALALVAKLDECAPKIANMDVKSRSQATIRQR